MANYRALVYIVCIITIKRFLIIIQKYHVIMVHAKVLRMKLIYIRLFLYIYESISIF